MALRDFLRPASLIPLASERELAVEPAFATGVLTDGDVGVLYLADAGLPPREPAVQRFRPDGRPDGDPIDLGQVFVVTAGYEVEGLKANGLVAVYGAAETREAHNEFAVADRAGEFLGRGSIATDAVVGVGAAAAALSDGGFAFLSASHTREGDQALLNFQRFTAGGDPAGDPLTVAELTGPQGSGQSITGPEAIAANGGVRVFWNDAAGLHTAVVENDGDVVGGRLLTAGSVGGADAARLSDGRVVATWSEDGHVVGALFGRAQPGQAPTEFQIGDGSAPEVVGLKDGGWAVSWHEGQTDGSTTARVFDRGGEGGTEFAARGDFEGVTPEGLVLALRHTDAGDVFVTRYAALPGLDLPGLDRLGDSLRDLLHRPASDWAL